MYSVLACDCLLWDVGNGSDSWTDYGRDNVGDVLFCGIGE